MNMGARALGGFLFFSIFAACSGGSDPGTGDAGTTGASSSSGSTSSSGGANGGSACTELHIGGTNDPGIGGGATSQVTAQAVSDVGGVSGTQLAELTTACKNMAAALGANATDQQTADAKTDAREKVDAWCKLAARSVQTSRAKAGGSTKLEYATVSWRTSVAMKAECQGRCAGTPCDPNATPMVCTGGKLANGFCEGGKLEGGCQVDARCDTSCDMIVSAKAECPEPSITVSTIGSSDPNAAAALKTALESSLPSVIALRNHCQLEAGIASAFSGTVSSITDIKQACIPPVVKAAQVAVQDIVVCAQATANLVAATQ